MQEITKNILEKLETLRDKINENVEYMILKYDLSNNKNHWNCICSAMDWIDVAKENIDSDLIRKEFKYMWKDVYSYLSAVSCLLLNSLGVIPYLRLNSLANARLLANP